MGWCKGGVPLKVMEPSPCLRSHAHCPVDGGSDGDGDGDSEGEGEGDGDGDGDGDGFW